LLLKRKKLGERVGGGKGLKRIDGKDLIPQGGKKKEVLGGRKDLQGGENAVDYGKTATVLGRAEILGGRRGLKTGGRRGYLRENRCGW